MELLKLLIDSGFTKQETTRLFIKAIPAALVAGLALWIITAGIILIGG